MQSKNERLSRLRLSLLRLKEEIIRLLPIFQARTPLVAGSVYELRRKCGKTRCGCAQGKLHSSWALSWSEEGRTHLHMIPMGRRVELRILSRRYQEFRKARSRLVKIYQEMIPIIDRIERLRRVQP